jgi:hypothetical protein
MACEHEWHDTDGDFVCLTCGAAAYECDQCDGTGDRYGRSEFSATAPKSACPYCRGTGWVSSGAPAPSSPEGGGKPDDDGDCTSCGVPFGDGSCPACLASDGTGPSPEGGEA